MPLFVFATVILPIPKFVERSLAQVQSDTPEQQKLFVVAEQAADKLIEMVSDKNSPPPRLSDPQVAYLFSVAFSPQIAVRGGSDFNNIIGISRLQEKSGELVRAYLVLGANASGAASSNSETDNQQVGRNLLSYLDEIALAYDFSLLAGSRIAEFVAGDPAFEPSEDVRSAIAQGQLRILNSVLACSTDSAIESPWRAERLAVINGTARNFAKLFDKKTAQSIADSVLAKAFSEDDESISDGLKRFALLILQRPSQ
ncbi:MAG: hypothetical protein ACR2O0_10750 [Rhizobiaceae bacterium]